MPIDFHCPQCNNLLRTPLDTAGRQAKCPSCGAVMTIPTPPPGTELAPTPPSPAPAGAMPLGMVRSTKLDLANLVDDTWAIFKKDWGPCVVVVLIVAMITVGVSVVGGLSMTMIKAIFRNDTLIVTLAELVNMLVGRIVQIWLMAGQIKFFLKIARRQPADVVEVFSGTPYIGTMFFATLVLGLIMFGMIMVFALPALVVGLATQSPLLAGIVLAVSMLIGIVPITIVSIMLSQFQYLIVDRHAGILESLEVSRQITHGNKLTLFFMGMIIFMLIVAGVLACCVGVLATAPFGILMGAVAYLTITGQMRAPAYEGS